MKLITNGKFLADITDVAISVFNIAIEKLADMRAENGAEQNRIMNSIEFLQTNMTNLEAAHGRIMDADILWNQPGSQDRMFWYRQVLQ